jgi:cathepsin H
MKTAFTALVLASAVAAIETNDLVFVNYLSAHGKMYNDMEEFAQRREIFLAKDRLIQQHMSRPSNFTMGHNKFSDRSETEMRMLLGDLESTETNAFCLPPPASHANIEVPNSVNWVEAGMTTPVKDQGSCGSCWTFATTSTVETANAIFGSGLVSLSE